VKLRKYVPLIILVLVVAFLACVYVPGYIRLLLFKRALGDFLNLIETGRIVKAADYVLDEEQARVLDLIRTYVPEGYQRDIQTLRVHRIERRESEYVVTLVVRIEGANYHFADKVRIPWHRVKGKWRFPFSGIEVAELLGEDWRILDYLLGDDY